MFSLFFGKLNMFRDSKAFFSKMSATWLMPILTLPVFEILYARWVDGFYATVGGEFYPRFAPELLVRSASIPDGSSNILAAVAAWGTAIFIFFILQMLAITASLYVMGRPLRRGGVYFASAFGGLFLACIAYAIVKFNPEFKTPGMREVVNSVELVAGIENVKSSLVFVNRLIPVTMVTLAFAMAALLWRRGNASESVQSLDRKFRQVRVLLVVYSVMIVVGTIEFRMIYELPSAYVGPTEAANLRRIATAVSGASGAHSTALLSILAAPFFWFMYARVRDLAASNVPDENCVAISTWIESNGLGVSKFKTIGTVIAIVAPSLANTIFDSIAASVNVAV